MSYQDEMEAARQDGVARFWAAVDEVAPDPGGAIRKLAELVGDRNLDPGKRRAIAGDLRTLRARLEARRQTARAELAEERHNPWRAAIKVSLTRQEAAAKVTMAVLENTAERNQTLLGAAQREANRKRYARSPLPVLRAIARSSCACGCREAAGAWLAEHTTERA